MAVVSLIDNQSRTKFFHETVVRNLEFWLNWLDEIKDADIEALYNVLHSGSRTGMAIQPLPPDSGIHFVTLPRPST